ncbi:hypothetical protein [Halostella salina]|uniref:hypothetical protein n=1 Tax=Halostella salina TaxID=1547897 RepID=UPI000EF83C5A|nr:hypothetical protein [Halostella salina]
MNSEDVRLLQQLLANRHGSLSLSELAAWNRESESELEQHLQDLQARGLVTTLMGDTTYYAVTEFGIQLLKQIGHFEQIGILYDMYEAAETEVKTGDRPQPEWL